MYHKLDIAISADSQTTLHSFYIHSEQDVILFNNADSEAGLALRSTDMASGMLDAFKSVKGYEMENRTFTGIHAELVLHYALYKEGFKISSTKESNMGTPRIRGLSGRIPFVPVGNDNDAIIFELFKYNGRLIW